MIKNILYSLFLHLCLFAIIYLSFNLKEVDENQPNELAISLVSLDGHKESELVKPEPAAPIQEEAKEVTKPEPKKEEKPVKKAEPEKKPEEKKPEKKQVKEQSQKIEKSKPAKPIDKPIIEEKAKEFKKPEPEEKKKQDSEKDKNDNVIKKDQDQKQNESQEKQKELIPKDKSKQEKEVESQKNVIKSSAVDMTNNLESIDLSAREKFNIQSQLKRCYKKILDSNKNRSEFVILIKAKITKDGYITSDLDSLVDDERYDSDSGYKSAIDNVNKTIAFCSPLRNLPLDKYDVWKEVVLEFDENDIK